MLETGFSFGYIVSERKTFAKEMCKQVLVEDHPEQLGETELSAQWGFPQGHKTETKNNCRWKMINSVKGTLRSA